MHYLDPNLRPYEAGSWQIQEKFLAVEIVWYLLVFALATRLWYTLKKSVRPRDSDALKKSIRYSTHETVML